MVSPIVGRDNGESVNACGPLSAQQGSHTSYCLSSSHLKECAEVTNIDDDTEFIKVKTGKKKKSGIMTKPDEADIVRTVGFPHELLDDRHVKGGEKIFDKLSFSNFCAGELEAISRPGIPADEKAARIGILKTICYHNSYLECSELKAQYGATMQRVERGLAVWNDALAERLHSDLAFRTGVIGRASVNNVKSNSNKLDKIADKEKQDKGASKRSESKLPTEVKLHYCLDFNKGSCSHSDHHDGKMGKLDVTLFHF